MHISTLNLYLTVYQKIKSLQIAIFKYVDTCSIENLYLMW